MSTKTETIVNDIAATKDIKAMRQDLRDLWDNFVISNDTTDAADRGNVFVTYQALDNALAAIQSMG